MPINGSDGLFQRLFNKIQPHLPQQPNNGPIPQAQEGPMPDYANQSIMPSWMRSMGDSAIGGAVDMTQGMLGMGNGQNKMNLAGQMIPAGLGVMGMAGKVGGIGKAIGNNPMTSRGTMESLGAPSAWGKFGTPGIAGPIKANPNAVPPYMSQQLPGIQQGSPLLDDTGRFLGFDKNVNPSFNSHVASSRNKLQPSTALATKSKGASISDEKLDKMMAKYKFGQKKAS